MERQRRNLAASVRQRLMNLARARKEDFQLLLTQYGHERLLYRITRSPYQGDFVLKGAALFQLWMGQPHRATRDLDLLGHGTPSTDCLRQVFQDICSASVVDDGLVFLADAIRAAQIKEDDEYQGIRLRIEARLGNARVPLQIDIGFGDAVTPGPQTVTFPVLLDFPPPQLQAYSRETVVAEKFQAMVFLGMANSRMKDFYDLWAIACRFDFDGAALCSAIHATFERRRTELPLTTPLPLTAEFSADSKKGIHWNAFLQKGRLLETPPPLEEVIELLESFLMPPTRALVSGTSWDRIWRNRTWS